MNYTQLTNTILDQSKDLVWVVNADYQLVYANKSYLSVVKMVTGIEQKINESAFVEGVDEAFLKKWKTYYSKALNGGHFEIDEHHYDSERNETRYGHVTFEPLIGDDNKVFAVACQSKDVTHIVKQRSEASQLIDASLDVFCTINKEGNFVYVSAAAATHWGYMPEELIGTPYANLILEEDIPKTNAMAAEILSGHETKTFTNRYKKKDGSIAYNLWSVRWDESTRLTYCVVRDAKETIEQEEKILQSEQRFKTLVQEGSDLIGILDKEGNYLYVSPTSKGVLGTPPEDFIGRNALEFIHPDDQERVLSSLQKIIPENKVIIEPFRFQNHKKEWRWVETLLTNMLDNPGVNGIVANSRDITAEVEEKQKSKLLESIITNTSDAVLITEADPQDEPGPRIIYVNEAFTKMTGYTSEEVIGKSPRFLQGPNSNKEELAKLGTALRNWEPYEITTINYKKSGEEFWVNFTVTPVADEKGWYTHWIAIERDVTEQKNKELVNELIAQVSSNFNLENDYIKSTHKLCETIGSFGQYDLVEIWTLNQEKKHMQLMNHYVGATEDEAFYSFDHQIKVFKESEGLIGRVWSAQSQIMWNEIDHNEDFKRKLSAKQIGLKSAIGIPLTSNNEVIGVLMVGTKKSSKHLANNTEVLQGLNGYLGSELKRKILEKDLSHLIDSIPDMITVGDFTGRFLKINKAGCEILGYTEKEILNQSFEQFIHPEDKEIAYNELKRLEFGTTTFNFEVRFITKSGAVIWLSWFCNSNIEEGLIYSTAKNITEEKKLRELNLQAGKLAKIGGWEVDLRTMTPYFSEETFKIYELPFGSPPKVEDGMKFYAPEVQPIIQEAVTKAIENNVSYNLEVPFITAKGKNIWVRIYGMTEVVDDKAVRLYGTIQDITEQREAENRLVDFSDNIPGVVYQYFIYPDGTDLLKNISGSVEQLWGFTPDQVYDNVDLIWEQIKAGGDFEKTQASILKSIETKSKWASRLKYVMPTGELRTHYGTGTPIFLADGTILFNSIVLDITQEVKNEEMLKQTTQMARIGSWEMDLASQEGDKMYWSPLMREILGVDQNFEASFNAGLEFCTKESKIQMSKAFTALLEENIEFDEEILLISAKGKEQWVRVLGKSKIVQGKSTRVYGSIQDIHAVKKITEKLQNVLREKANILESIGDAFFAVDRNWVVTYWNKQAEIALEKNRDDIIGKNLWDEYPDVKGLEFYSQYHKAMETGDIVNFEEHYPALNVWFEVTVYPSNDGLSIYFKDVTGRKIAEQERNRLQTTIENSLNEIYMFDSETFNFIYLNKGAKKNLGYTKEELDALTPLDLKPDYTVSSFNELVAPLKNYKKEKVIFYTNHKRKDGSLYPVEVHLQLIDHGTHENFLAVVLDITERKKAKESILQANERFEKVTEATNDVIWDWDIANNTFYRSEAIEQFFGNQASKLLNKENFWQDSFHPDDKDEIQKSVEEAIADPLCARWKEEYRLFKEDGSLLYVTDQGVIIRNNEGVATRMVGAMTDVTEQKKAEEMYRLLANNSNDIITLQDINNQLKYISPSVENILDYKQEELTDKDFLELIHKDDVKKIDKTINKNVLEDKYFHTIEYRIRHKDGHYVWLEESVSPVFEKGQVVSFVTTNRDISEWILAKKEIENYQSSLQRLTVELSLIEEKQKKEIAANIHDHLSQSLVISKMRISDLERRAELENIQEDLIFIKDHISNALENSRRITYDLSPPVLYQLGIIDALAWFAGDTENKYGIKFEFNTNTSTIKLNEFKSILLFRCIQEAVTNTIKYANASLITLNLIKDEETITVILTDNGKGFDTSKLSNNVNSGSGFGLFAVKERIKNMNGELFITSELNIGTKIKIHLSLE